jgi:amino acid adenylation domain-containing protein
MLAAVLGVMKAGGAYVPLATDQPKARLQQQLIGVKAVITQSSLRERLPEFSGAVVLLDQDNEKWAAEAETNPEPNTTAEDLVYVLYTSGSTGVPKGVAVRHRNLVNYATHIVRALKLQQEEAAGPLKFATVSTLGADLGNTSIYPALIAGHTVNVVPYEVATDGERIGRYAEQYGIDVLKIVPSHLSALLESKDAVRVLPKKYLIVGGEALTSTLLEKLEALNATCEVMNHYAPTETTVGSLMLPLKGYGWKEKKSSVMPLGRPIQNTRVYVLDAQMQVLPAGVAGELWIGGAGVTAGYWSQAEKTAERFLASPFREGDILYRTGDRARWDAEGRVEFLGRVDDQVKVRGFRVELGEIASALERQPGVKQAVVVVREREAGGEKQLVGYVAANREANLDSDKLRQALQSELPEYMIPGAVVVLEKLPLTANGKVDRKALPEPEAQSRSKQYRAPQTVTEQMVAQIWAEVLRLDEVSADDDFFSLGGHSLLATQVISRIREKCHAEIALRTIFESPVLERFAAAVDEAIAAPGADIGAAPIKRVARQNYRTAKV